MTLFTTAYAGSGKLDEELTAHYLDQLLPENLGMVYIPDGEIPRRKLPGLANVVAWLTKEVGTEGTIQVPDLIAALVKRRDTEGDEVALVLVHNAGNEADVELARAAHAQGIRVIDLTKAANDMLFEDEPGDDEPADDETPPFDTDEATPAEAAADAAEQELGLTEETEAAADRAAERTAPSPAAEIARAAAAGLAAAAARQAAPLTLTLTLPLGQDFIDALADAIVQSMGREAQATLASAPALTLVPAGDVVAPAVPIGSTGGNKADVAGQPENTSVYYYNADAATYRPARGKPRAEETRVFLTKEDIAEAKAKGMLG